MTTDLALAPQVQRGGLLDMATWNLMRDQCGVLVKSGFLPKGVDTAEKALAIGLKAHELGLGLMTAFGGMSVVNGKIVIEGHLLLALIRRVPGAKFDVIEHTDTLCRATIGRPGHDDREVSFTIEEARKAGLITKPGPWQTYPKDMLYWRTVSRASKYMFSDVTNGMPLRDEVETIDVEVTSVTDKAKAAQNLLGAAAKPKVETPKPPEPPPAPALDPEARADPKVVDDMIKWFAKLGMSEEDVLAERMCIHRDDLRNSDIDALREIAEAKKGLKK